MNNRLKNRIFLASIICLAVFFTAGPVAAAANTGLNRQQLREEIKKILHEDPNMILDILRDNSEVVLDVAQQGADVRRLRMLKAQWEQDLTQPKSVRLTGRPTLGADKAPVTIVAFTDFTCAYCRQGEKALSSIYESYNGKVRLVYKSLPMPTHPGSVEASQFMLAAYSQDKNKSWKLFQDFFENRDTIISNEGHAFLRSSAINAGLNITKLLTDAKSANVQKIIAEDEQDADTLGFEGTPCFLVNNIVIRGALSESLFRAAVDMALAEAEKKK